MTRALAVLALLALLLLGAACSGSGGGDEAGGSVPAVEEAPEPRPDPAVGEGGAAGDAAGRGGGAGDGQGGNARSVPQTRAVIHKGSVSLHAEDVTAARFDVLEVVDRHEGEVADEETATDDEGRLGFARIVLRVPSDRFDDAMRDLEQVAALESSTRSSEDVTTQVIDTEARIRAQERSLRRVEALLAEAEDLRELIQIEAQLTQRQAELDSLKQQLAWLAEQTSMSRITVHLDRAPEPEEKDDEQRAGFLVGLDAGWDALVTLGRGTAHVAGLLLPFTVLLAVGAVVLWPAVRAVRRRRAPASGSAMSLQSPRPGPGEPGGPHDPNTDAGEQ